MVLVHGVVLGGREAWRAQRPLTERWTLLAPDRPGHGLSPDARQDFEAEAPLVADQLLDAPAHLVGHSYGAIVAMLAAARRPENVRTLTVVEPPAVQAAAGHPDVDRWAAGTRSLFSDPGDDLPGLLARFYAFAGVAAPIPEPLPEPLERGARALAGARPPSEAALPLAELAGSAIPMLAVTGGHSEFYETICDAIAAATGAHRAVIPGQAHLVQDTGEPFNALLEAFWGEAG